MEFPTDLSALRARRYSWLGRRALREADAEARSEVVAILVNALRPESRSFCRHRLADHEPVQLDIDELVVLLLVPLEVVVAQAESYREPRRHFPVVVSEEAIPIVV